MINLAGVRAVQTRIAELQERFGMPSGGVPGESFHTKLKKEIAKNDTAKVEAVPKEAEKTTAASKVHDVYPMVNSQPLANPSLDTMISDAAKKYNVDPKLVSAIAAVESGGNQSATSEVGAIGVMQLMPDTAAGLGVDPYDKQQNVEGGTKYIKSLLDTFGGDVEKAVAAYNAGPQAVKDYGGVPPYRETQNYVNKVLDIYR